MTISPFIKQAGNRVQRVRTDVSDSQMAQAIINVWRKKFGTTPSKDQVAMILAQNDLETGHRKSMWNYNVGNITTGSNTAYNYFDDLTTSEQIKPNVWKKMNLKYRAYPNLEAGVEDYINFLSSGNYAKAWEHIKNPDPVAFSKALKRAGYYTANEAPYTKSLTNLFENNSKANSYELAMSGKVKSPDSKENSMVATKNDKDNILKQYLARLRGKEMDIYDEVANRGKTPTTPAASPDKINNILDHYLQMIAASEKTNKKLYKKYLTSNQSVIRVSSKDYIDSVEFARVLCSVLEEELVATAFTHTDGDKVEVDCQISGPTEDCFHAVEQLTLATVEAFKKATKKIGGIEIQTKLITNKKSYKDQIGLKTAKTQHRKFLLKFI